MRKQAFIGLSLLLSMGFGSSALALTITPGRTYVRLLPGEHANAVISAHNETTDRIQVELSKKDWFVLPDNKALTVKDWLELKGPTYFWLKPGERRDVTVKVKCPKKAVGELVGMVSFAYQGESVSMVTPMISVSVYTTAVGTERLSGFIKDLAVRRWQDRTQVAIGLISNGNIHLRPTGHVLITDSKGKTAANFTIKEGDPVYPGQERAYFGEDMSLKLAPGRYNATVSLTYKDLVLGASKELEVKADGSIQMAKSLKDQSSSNPGPKGAAPVQ
jgi:hypothetical protein